MAGSRTGALTLARVLQVLGWFVVALSVVPTLLGVGAVLGIPLLIVGGLLIWWGSRMSRRADEHAPR